MNPRERANGAVLRIAEQLTHHRAAAQPATLDQGASGIALLFAELGRTDASRRVTAHAWLAHAGREVPVRGGDGLYQGAGALGFALQAAAVGPHDYHQALLRLDEFVFHRVRDLVRQCQDRRRSGIPGVSLKHYDLVSGITGLGVYLLHRRSSSSAVHAVLLELVALSEPARDPSGRYVPGWWTPATPTPGLPAAYPLGHYNLGVAHGISGPLAFLARAWEKGQRVPGQRQAITRIAEWLSQWRKERKADTPWYGWPGVALPAGQDGYTRPTLRTQRPVWCYGTAGVSRALQLAGSALSRPDWESAAVDGLAEVLDNPDLTKLITDTSLCHGWSGLLHATWHVARKSGDQRLRNHLPLIVDALVNNLSPAGAPVGFLTGSAGVALALNTFVTDDESRSGWDRALALA